MAKSLLTAALILPSINIATAEDYSSTVLKDGPLGYYRLNDSTERSNVNLNSGSAGSAGNATNLNSSAFAGAIAGDKNRGQFYDSSARAITPWNAALNPHESKPFTMEGWFYPASDQINAGQAVVANRYAYSGVNRQGWVIFQRAQDDTYAGKGGYEGVGWNFRMYRGSGGSSGLDVTSQVPFAIGKWTHVVVVYDPAAADGATVTMFIDGVEAASNTWVGDGPGYVANTDDHPTDEAVRGPAGLAFGSYNNTAPGSNPYFGGVDEFAFYDTRLTSAQILAHYQNGTNASRTVSYSSLVQASNPSVYHRLDELPATVGNVQNLGDLRNAGTAINTVQVQQQIPGVVAGGVDDGAFGYHFRNAGTSVTDIPWAAQNNPAEGLPFTVEVWVKPTSDRQNPGASLINNRYVASGNRTGWVIFQRAPNDTYSGVSGYSGVGWTFRMFTGAGGSGQDVITSLPYTVGEWQHLVFTWVPEADTGNGNWTGTLSAFVNGKLAGTNPSALYKANQEPNEDASAPTDLAIGAYNKASGLGNNPFEGQVSEFALYNNYALTPEQVTGHFQAATNTQPTVNYSTLVLTSAYDGAGTQRSMPATYLRFNDAAANPVVNAGTLGSAANGALVATVNNSAGPASSDYSGFSAPNSAVATDPGFVSLNNPPGLNFLGQITLEAWIKPGATLGAKARIVSHGPQTLSSYTADNVSQNGSILRSSEVFLGIKDGTDYVVGSDDGETALTGMASFAIPAGDLAGTGWLHLVGTYDGANWNLYRNGIKVATAQSAFGAVHVDGAGWAIGSSGIGWEDNFTGSIDEVAIYGKALTSSQIAAHYSMGLSAVAPQTKPAQPQDSGLTPLGTTIYVNSPSTTLNNDNVEALGVAVISNGNVVVSWEDDGDDLGDQEAVWTILSPSGVPLTPLTTITTIDPSFTGQTLESRFLSYFRTDGSAISGRTSWGPKIKANLFGAGFGMGATSFYLGLEIPEFAAINNNAAGENAGDFPAVQLLSNDGRPQGIVSGLSDDYAERDGDVRIGDWDRLSNGNLVIVGESRQRDDLVNLYGGESPQNHGLVSVFKPDGTEVKSIQLLSSAPVKVEIWHGTAVTANGFAVRYSAVGRAKIRLFTNDGNAVGAELDAAAVTGSEISAGGGRGENIGFNGNGKDAYVLATAGTDAAGAPQIWVAVLNADGTKRWAHTLAGNSGLPHGAIGSRVDAAIDSLGRVAVVYTDTAATLEAGGTASLVLGRMFDATGAPIGGVFQVSEKELPSAEVLGTSNARVDWRGNTLAVIWLSKNQIADNPDAKQVIALRTFNVAGGVVVVTPTLSAASNGDGSLNITFTGTLQESSTVNGVYTPVVSAVSPLKVTPGAGSGAKFYRTTSGQ